MIECDQTGQCSIPYYTLSGGPDGWKTSFERRERTDGSWSNRDTIKGKSSVYGKRRWRSGKGAETIHPFPDRRKRGRPFSQFMEWCLYHPTFGYYQTEDVRIGKEGDYYTSSCVHPSSDTSLRSNSVRCPRSWGERAFDLVEMGAEGGFSARIFSVGQERRLRLLSKTALHAHRNSPFLFERTEKKSLPKKKERARFFG